MCLWSHLARNVSKPLFSTQVWTTFVQACTQIWWYPRNINTGPTLKIEQQHSKSQQTPSYGTTIFKWSSWNGKLFHDTAWFYFSKILNARLFIKQHSLQEHQIIKLFLFYACIVIRYTRLAALRTKQRTSSRHWLKYAGVFFADFFFNARKEELKVIITYPLDILWYFVCHHSHGILIRIRSIVLW